MRAPPQSNEVLLLLALRNPSEANCGNSPTSLLFPLMTLFDLITAVGLSPKPLHISDTFRFVVNSAKTTDTKKIKKLRFKFIITETSTVQSAFTRILKLLSAQTFILMNKSRWVNKMTSRFSWEFSLAMNFNLKSFKKLMEVFSFEKLKNTQNCFIFKLCLKTTL